MPRRVKPFLQSLTSKRWQEITLALKKLHIAMAPLQDGKKTQEIYFFEPYKALSSQQVTKSFNNCMQLRATAPHPCC